MHTQTTPGRSQQQGFLQGRADVFSQATSTSSSGTAVPPAGLCWRGCHCHPLLLPLRPLLLPRPAQCGPPSVPTSTSTPHTATLSQPVQYPGDPEEAKKRQQAPAQCKKTLVPSNFQFILSRDLPLRPAVSCALLQAPSWLFTLHSQIITVHRTALPLCLSPVVCNLGSPRSSRL